MTSTKQENSSSPRSSRNSDAHVTTNRGRRVATGAEQAHFKNDPHGARTGHSVVRDAGGDVCCGDGCDAVEAGLPVSWVRERVGCADSAMRICEVGRNLSLVDYYAHTVPSGDAHSADVLRSIIDNARGAA